MRKFRSIQFDDEKLSRFQGNVDNVLEQLTTNPLMAGTLIEGVSLAASQDNQVGHQLGRAYRLWIVVKNNANAVVWEQTSVDSSKFVNLHASAACTVSLWVA